LVNTIEATFTKLDQVLAAGAQHHVEHLMVKDHQAMVELRSLAKAKNWYAIR